MNQAVLNVIAEMETVFEKAGGGLRVCEIYNCVKSGENLAGEEIPYVRAQA